MFLYCYDYIVWLMILLVVKVGVDVGFNVFWIFLFLVNVVDIFVDVDI